MKRAAFITSLVLVACQGGSPAGAPPQKAAGESPAPKDTKPAVAEAPPQKAAPTVRTREPANPRELTVSGATRDEIVPGLHFVVPAEWARKPSPGPMRLAEFTLPGPGGDAELLVHQFKGGGGDAKSNVFRWRTQFTHPDGSPLGETEGKVTEEERAPLQLTKVDLEGTYVAAVTPGSPEKYSDPNYRMLAVIVEGAGDPYFFKAVGPAKTLALWAAAFDTFAGTLAPSP